MRQTKAYKYGLKRSAVFLCTLFFALFIAQAAFAQINVSVQLEGDIVNANGDKLNDKANLTVSANWSGGEQPYTVKLINGGQDLVTVSDITENNWTHSLAVNSMNLADGATCQLRVSVTDKDGVAGNADADKTFIFDRTNPVLTAIFDKSEYKNGDKVTLTITSDEDVNTPSVIMPGKTVEFQQESGTPPSRNYVFSLQVNDDVLTTGQHAVNISALDTSLPVPHANNGITNVTFAYSKSPLMSKVENVQVQLTGDAAGTAPLNAGATITGTVSWTAEADPDTTPFYNVSCTIGGTPVSLGTFSETNAPFSIPAATIAGTGPLNVKAKVIDNNGMSAEGTSQGSFTIDKAVPVLTAQVTNATGGFPKTGTVQIQVLSNKTVNPPVVTSNGVTAELAGTAAPAMSFNYNLKLNNTFADGTHTANIEATDTTVPAALANKGTTSVTFQVGSGVTGSTVITEVTPNSPTNVNMITVRGTCPEGAVKVEVKAGGSVLATTAVSGGASWFVSLPDVAEGTYMLTATSYDATDSVISTSQEFPLQVDLTKPETPTFDTASVPTKTNQSTLVIQVTAPGFDTEASKPLRLVTSVNGVESAPVKMETPVMPVTVNLTPGINNITFLLRDNAGNSSAVSATARVEMSGEASGAIVSMMVADMPVPLPETYFLGKNTAQTISFILDHASDATTLPLITIETEGGQTTKATGAWQSPTSFSGTFKIETGFNGKAKITVSGIKDSFGSFLPDSPYENAFTADTLPPVSSFDSQTDIYVNVNNPNITLKGTVNDSEGGSGVDYLDLYIQAEGSTDSTTIRIPLQIGAQSPWSYNWDASALAPGTHEIWTIATDMAKPAGNVESASGKAKRKVIVDKEVPTVTRVSLNNSGTDMGTEPVTVNYDVTKIVAVMDDASGSGINLTASTLVLKNSLGTEVTGEATNNGQNTIYYQFNKLAPGEYTIEVKPVDKAGNEGAVDTRKFTVLDSSVSQQADVSPPNGSVANKTHTELAQNKVKAVIKETSGIVPDYSQSGITVTYEGSVVGIKDSAVTDALVANLYGNEGLKTDQSHDGEYTVTLKPVTVNGQTSEDIVTTFIYDTQAPVVKTASPDFLSIGAPGWAGLQTPSIDAVLSDAPADIAAQGAASSNSLAWAAGQGSGVDTSKVVFTWTLADQVCPPFGVENDVVGLRMPSPPEDKTAGAVMLPISLTTADKVTEGETVPNTKNYTGAIIFDYVPPAIGDLKGRGTYSGNTVTITGTAEDPGSFDGLQIVSVEYKDNDGGSWVEVPIAAGKSVNFSVMISLQNKSEGEHKVNFRATDKGGNVSEEAVISYKIDRTPPPTTSLTWPLNEYLTNKKVIQMFWTKTTDTAAYVLQVADDSAFNNVLNNDSNSEQLYGLPGSIVSDTADTTVAGNFTVPKDGTYYWRVFSVKKTTDGSIPSKPSFTRSFSVDTVKPRIISVSPSPASSNMVGTGQVTFTVRFTEVLSNMSEVRAFLVTSGGSSMKIEEVSREGDTWVGTTVIPENDSALNDGSAILKFEGAADLAGNVMAPDSTNRIIINTSPSFQVRIFSNPMNRFEIIIVAKSSETLQAPPYCSVKQNGATKAVTMQFLKAMFYSGSYRLDMDNPGKAYITLTGMDLGGKSGTNNFEFAIADLNASQRLNISLSNGATLKGAEGSAYQNTSIYMFDRETLDSPFPEVPLMVRTNISQNFSRETLGELRPVLALEQIGPENIPLKKRLQYSAEIDEETLPYPAEKTHLYRQAQDGSWIFQGGNIADGKITAEVSGLGRLALLADVTPPAMKVLSPAPFDNVEEKNPIVTGQITENGSGLDLASFRFAVNGREVRVASLDADGKFSFRSDTPFMKGKNDLAYEVRDNAGNLLRNSYSIRVDPFAVQEFAAYPNPVTRGNKVNFNYNFNYVPDSVILKIYDTAGQLVVKLDKFDLNIGGHSGKASWNLKNSSGRRVANGVYFYRLETTRRGVTAKQKGKIAIAR